MASQKQGLDVRQQADGNTFFEERMRQLLPFSLLPGKQHFFARGVVHQHGAALGPVESFGRDLAAIEPLVSICAVAMGRFKFVPCWTKMV